MLSAPLSPLPRKDPVHASDLPYMFVSIQGAKQEWSACRICLVTGLQLIWPAINVAK